MAGWSNRSDLNCVETLKNLTTDEIWVDLNVLDDRSGKRDCSTERSGISMELESEFNGFLSEDSDLKKNDEEYLHLDLEKSESSFTTAEKSCKLEDARRSVESDGGTENVNHSRTINDEEWNVKRKRKRERYNELLSWITEVARNPCNPSLGSLPDRSKWKLHGNEQLWKQVLSVREQLFLKKNADSSNQQSIWQKKQKMHPTMYEDQGGFERSRCSQRILSAKQSPAFHSLKVSQSRPYSESSSSSSATQSDIEDRSNKQSDLSISDLWVRNHPRQRIPVGPHFQAKVPEWTGEVQESDTKWLGTQIWPLDKGEKRNHLIERDRIGKGRQDSCGCRNLGSVECVQFHISEKRIKLKLELCSAFHTWKFDEMGEQVSLSWKEEEEKKFLDVVKLNPSSLEKGYFGELSRIFPRKCKGKLVSYFYNVILLRRRSHQNRYTPDNIDSDDEEPEFGSVNDGVGQGEINSAGSILRSPRKLHLNNFR